MHEEEYGPIEERASTDDEAGSDVFEDGPALITCVACGHPNLEFRNHCRRCGFSLQGAANILPGVELLEWTATDGPARKGPKRSRPAVLIFAGLAAVALPLLALRPRIIGAVLLTGGAVWLAMYVAKRLAGEHLGREDDLQAAPAETTSDPADAPGHGEPEAACPECGVPIAHYDDICPECGAIVGI